MRICNLSDEDVILLKSQQMNIEIRDDTNALFAENDPKDECRCSKSENYGKL